MFKIIENYKQLFTMFTKSEFAGSETPNTVEDTNDSWFTVDELIKASLENKEIDRDELLQIKEKFDEEKENIWDETKKSINKFLQKVSTEMLSDGMSVNWIDGFNKLVDQFKAYWFDIKLAPSLAYKLNFAKKHNKKLWKFHVEWDFDGNILSLDVDTSKLSQINNDYVDDGELSDMGYNKSDFMDTAMESDKITKEKEIKKINDEALDLAGELWITYNIETRKYYEIWNEHDPIWDLWDTKEELQIMIDDIKGYNIAEELWIDYDELEGEFTPANSNDIVWNRWDSKEQIQEKINSLNFSNETILVDVDSNWNKQVTEKKGVSKNKDTTKFISIVDYLASKWIDSSFKNRKTLAIENWIKDYKWTAKQNTALLNILQSGNENIVDSTETTDSWVEILEDIKVTYELDHEKIRYALGHLEEWGTPKEGNASNFVIWEYFYTDKDWEQQSDTIKLKQFNNKKYVEMDGTRFWNDIDKRVEVDTADEVEKQLNTLIEQFQDELNEDLDEVRDELEEEQEKVKEKSKWQVELVDGSMVNVILEKDDSTPDFPGYSLELDVDWVNPKKFFSGDKPTDEQIEAGKKELVKRYNESNKDEFADTNELKDLWLSPEDMKKLDDLWMDLEKRDDSGVFKFDRSGWGSNDLEAQINIDWEYEINDSNSKIELTDEGDIVDLLISSDKFLKVLDKAEDKYAKLGESYDLTSQEKNFKEYMDEGLNLPVTNLHDIKIAIQILDDES